jgi:hypothetical protein
VNRRLENARTPGGDHELSASPHNAPQFADQALHVRHEEDREHADDSIEALVRITRRCHIADPEFDIGQPRAATLARQAGRQIDTDDTPAWSDSLSRRQRRGAGAATDIEYLGAKRQREALNRSSADAIPER